MKSNKKNKKNSLDWQFWTFIPIVIIWASTFFLYKLGLNKAQQGQFGDMFGAVNALFSGLAFWGLIITIRQQRDDLKLQSKELKETKDEFRNQNFQTTFFNLLRTQREIIDEFHLNIFSVNNEGVVTYRKSDGRRLFRALKKELQSLFSALELASYSDFNLERVEYEIQSFPEDTKEESDKLLEYLAKVNKLYILNFYGINEEEFNKYKGLTDEQIIEKVQFVYSHFFHKQNYAVGHYFRHFYHMLLFLEKSENNQVKALSDGQKSSKEIQIETDEINEEFMNYVDFIKAQIDIPESIILFYNSFNYPKAKRLLEKYQILDVLHNSNLIDIRHDVFPEYNIRR
jgi:hypothetical protein